MATDCVVTSVLVVGGGPLARRVHVPYFAAHPHVDRLLVCDTKPDAAHAAAQVSTKVEVHTGGIDEAGAHVVVIATPAVTHAELATQAVAAGAAVVVVEKPLAVDPVEASDLVAGAMLAGTRLHPCYTARWRPEATMMRDMVMGGELGRVQHVDARWQRHAGVPGTSAAADGVVWDLGAHLVDLALWATGWAARGSATARALCLGGQAVRTAHWYTDDQLASSAHLPVGPDSVVGLVDLEDGLISLLCSWASPVQRDVVEITVTGDAGRIRWNTVLGFSPARSVVPAPALVLERPGQAPRILVNGQLREPVEYTQQLAAVFPIHADTPRQADPWTALASVAVCHALAESARSGNPANISALLASR